MNKEYLDKCEKAGESPIGQRVVYDDYGKREFGVITSWNSRFVFVRFGIAENGQACDYEKIKFENAKQELDPGYDIGQW